MIQVATPSRERVEHYQALRVKVEREVGRINGEYGRVGVPAVHYLHQSYSRTELAALYCAADVMMVTPLRDGMNLVAKEYVASRANNGGALVLSEFAGAATELRQAFLCNPHDPDGVKDALLRAVHVDRTEARRRMRADAAPPAQPRRRPLGPVVPDRAGSSGHRGDGVSESANDESPAAADDLDPELRAAIGRIARVPQLLVACDYDGTLAPIVEDPSRAVPLRESVAAVRALAALPQTTVAVVSGRALRDLAALSRLPGEVHLVGSHGSEFDIGFVERLPPELIALRTRLRNELRELTAGKPGIRMERKPASMAVHTRGADPQLAARGGRGDPGRTGDLGRHHRHPGQGGHRAVGGHHPQGHRPGPAAHPALGQRRALHRRRRHRRERLRQPARPRHRHQDRTGRDPRRLPGRRADRGRPRPRPAAGDPPQLALRRARRADRAALDARQRAYGRAADPGRPGDLALPPEARLGGDLRRPGRRQPGRALQRHPAARRHPARASATGATP